MPSERRQTFFKGQMVYQKNIMVLKLFPTRAVQVKEVIFFFLVTLFRVGFFIGSLPYDV